MFRQIVGECDELERYLVLSPGTARREERDVTALGSDTSAHWHCQNGILIRRRTPTCYSVVTTTIDDGQMVTSLTCHVDETGRQVDAGEPAIVNCFGLGTRPFEDDGYLEELWTELSRKVRRQKQYWSRTVVKK